MMQAGGDVIFQVLRKGEHNYIVVCDCDHVPLADVHEILGAWARNPSLNLTHWDVGRMLVELVEQRVESWRLGNLTKGGKASI
jgi:hypothetical protein